MYGVVLWSDRRQNRAVIWCEDHGDLAFFRGKPGAPERIGVDAGDLVQFELGQGGGLRLASLPKLVAQDSHPTLGRDLMAASMQAGGTACPMPQAPPQTQADAGEKRVVGLPMAPRGTQAGMPSDAPPRSGEVIAFNSARCAEMV